MKIQPTSPNVPPGGTAGAVRETTPAIDTAAPGARRNEVDLSPAARHLAALQGDGNDIRAERVRQIRDALATGELRIDPGRIADGLLASVRELLK